MTSTSDDDKRGEASAPSLKPDIQAKIGEKLQEVYSDVLNEPVPDRFLDLLDQLEKSTEKTAR